MVFATNSKKKHFLNLAVALAVVVSTSASAFAIPVPIQDLERFNELLYTRWKKERGNYEIPRMNYLDIDASGVMAAEIEKAYFNLVGAGTQPDSSNLSQIYLLGFDMMTWPPTVMNGTRDFAKDDAAAGASLKTKVTYWANCVKKLERATQPEISVSVRELPGGGVEADVKELGAGTLNFTNRVVREDVFGRPSVLTQDFSRSETAAEAVRKSWADIVTRALAGDATVRITALVDRVYGSLPSEMESLESKLENVCGYRR